MSCPICSHNELEEGAENCPKCGSDLEIFSHIESVHKAETFQKKAMLVLTGLLGIVMVSWGSVTLFSGPTPAVKTELAVADTTNAVTPVEDPLNMAAASKPVEEFVADNAESKPEVAPLNADAEVKPEAKVEAKAEVKAEVKPAVKAEVKVKAKVEKKAVVKETKKAADGGVTIHKVRKGDSFWKISKKYFGNGSHAKQIASDNGLNPKKDIPLGTKLKINK